MPQSPIIERFFTGVERTRGSLALAERAHGDGRILHYAFEPAGLRLRRPRKRGDAVLSVLQGLSPRARRGAAEQLFSVLFPQLLSLHGSARFHGAVHPGNVVFVRGQELELVDVALNRCALFVYGAGPIHAEPGQTEYKTWLWSLSRPSAVDAARWDMACLAGMCAQVSAGMWQGAWRPGERLEAVERWAQAVEEGLPHGADLSEQLRSAYSACLLVEACL